MSNSFSIRQKIIGPKDLGPKEMPIELRNRIWNVVKDYIDNKFSGNIDREYAIELIWDKFFKQDKDDLRSWDSFR
jgi:hypothetical protein